MRFNKDLIPILRKEDMDIEAEKFLRTYCPEALKTPMPVPVEDIAELKLGLAIDYVNITEDSKTLGMMIFSDGVAEIYSHDLQKYVREEVSRGTMLIERDLCDEGNRGRERFTITHEIMHWDKHQLRFTILALKDKTLAKACRCPKEKVLKAKTPDEWMEWQADNLAAAVLMPKEMFKLKAEQLKRKHPTRIKLDIGETIDFDADIIQELIIDKLAETFQVSKQAAGIRLKPLGLLE